MGIITGMLLPIDGTGTEKGYRKYNEIPGFERGLGFIEQLGCSSNKKKG
ncbi:MAG: hypothetical protein GWO07_13890 [Candidatus Dadabacteria bacterium]|nr:hypothetical protein [Candidatus Dadabacteria bacterium]NIS09810.1 hypothetical protein [Candidatus Dadabacteria bacterium]NIV41166.1 hypothetical protein [Candidatus Dadabacteria bacterium]NIY22871.1 hypothetical protein [Candidatus Dadabacteria bacterium]